MWRSKRWENRFSKSVIFGEYANGEYLNNYEIFEAGADALLQDVIKFLEANHTYEVEYLIEILKGERR